MASTAAKVGEVWYVRFNDPKSTLVWEAQVMKVTERIVVLEPTETKQKEVYEWSDIIFIERS